MNPTFFCSQLLEFWRQWNRGGMSSKIRISCLNLDSKSRQEDQKQLLLGFPSCTWLFISFGIHSIQMKRTEHEKEEALSQQRGILQCVWGNKSHKHYNSVNNALYLKGSGYIYHLASCSLPSRGVSEYKTLTWFDGPVLSSQSAPALQLDILSKCFKWSQRIKT